MKISTPRLLLRSWTPGDLDALTEINADPQVNAWLGGDMVARHSANALQTICERLDANGWGVLALCDPQGSLLGLAGLQPVRPALPVAPAVEAVWRLRRSAWGRGYVVEAMWAILAALPQGAPTDIVALIARPNLRSARTAQALGFRHDPEANFLHPALDDPHPLRPHDVYRRACSVTA